ncbi:MAG: orotate phosphoribosyltransferase [Methylococcales bacterium]|jgi:orotate phosphoribosyltransferase|nr:orotate phosphoribosyltransferase [Methylococcales bacterium]
MLDFQKDFITYALNAQVLKFGEFTLKSGRISPYFFNTGLFNTGEQLGKLGEFYALALQQSTLNPDVLYGPAYKGIPLVNTTAIAYSRLFNKETPFTFNRKEAKDHGEGGALVGAPLHGQILILDDVITAGTSVRESVEIITQAGASPCGVLIALDRQEQGPNNRSAIAEVEEEFNIPVVSIINLETIISYLSQQPQFKDKLAIITEYRNTYGVAF